METPTSTAPTAKREGPAYRVIGAISVSHMINDMMQSTILAIYPLLKTNFGLSFGQIGLITLTYQLTASLLQPLVGLYTDKHHKPYSLPVGMSFTLVGLLLLAFATSYTSLLFAAALVGTGSSIFHPESSRVARMASGGQHGLAQSLFQVGGNFGSSLGPLLAAAIIVPFGQHSVAWFAGAALVGIALLYQVSRWYAAHQAAQRGKPRAVHVTLPRNRVIGAVSVLLLLVFSKHFYMAGLQSYLTFYLISKFQLSVQSAQLHLFLFLFSVAAGTVIGGPIGDRIGRKRVIWFSILGVAPFSLALPYASLFWTSVLTVVIGFIIASAFSAIVVYAQELMPGKVGTVAGLFFGFAFGVAGLGAGALGYLADATSIEHIYHICSFLPLLGIVTIFLPEIERHPPTVAMPEPQKA